MARYALGARRLHVSHHGHRAWPDLLTPPICAQRLPTGNHQRVVCRGSGRAGVGLLPQCRHPSPDRRHDRPYGASGGSGERRVARSRRGHPIAGEVGRPGDDETRCGMPLTPRAHPTQLAPCAGLTEIGAKIGAQSLEALERITAATQRFGGDKTAPGGGRDTWATSTAAARRHLAFVKRALADK